MKFLAVRKSNNEVIAPGDTIVSFRGEPFIFDAVVEGGTKLQVHSQGSFGRLFFPIVFDVRVIGVEDSSNE